MATFLEQLEQSLRQQQPIFRPTAIEGLLQTRPEATVSEYSPQTFIPEGLLNQQTSAARTLGLLGAGFAPGAGFADYGGTFPSFSGVGFEPGFEQNIRQGNYGTAALQGLGAFGDAATVAAAALGPAAPLAAGIGAVAKAPRAAQRGVKGLIDAVTPPPKSVMPQADEMLSIFHGTSPESARAIEQSGFDVTRSADGTVWFTSNPEIGEVAATGKGAVVERLIDERKLKLGGWKETDKYSTDELIQQGYDGLKLVDGNEVTYQIFDPEKLVKPSSIDNLISDSRRLRQEYEANPNQRTLQKYLDAKEAEMFARDQRAVSRAETRTVEEVADVVDYRGSHTAPSPEFGAPLHDLTGGGQIYPPDVYSPNAVQYYGTGYPSADREAFALARKVRGNPEATVTMYRAVPKNQDITSINEGDWVTLSKDYARTHGESVLGNDFIIIEQKVKAKDLWTNADSIHEFGYWPSK